MVEIEPVLSADEGEPALQEPTSGKEQEDGRELYGQGKYREARDAWDRSVRSCDYVLSRISAGEMADRSREEYKAMRLKALANSSMASLKLGEYGAAAASAGLVVKEQPENEKAVYRLARAYLEMGKAELACKAVDEAEQSVGNVSAALVQVRSEARRSRAVQRRVEKAMFAGLSDQKMGSIPRRILEWFKGLLRRTLSFVMGGAG